MIIISNWSLSLLGSSFPHIPHFQKVNIVALDLKVIALAMAYRGQIRHHLEHSPIDNPRKHVEICSFLYQKKLKMAIGECFLWMLYLNFYLIYIMNFMVLENTWACHYIIHKRCPDPPKGHIKNCHELHGIENLLTSFLYKHILCGNRENLGLVSLQTHIPLRQKNQLHALHAYFVHKFG